LAINRVEDVRPAIKGVTVRNRVRVSAEENFYDPLVEPITYDIKEDEVDVPVNLRNENKVVMNLKKSSNEKKNENKK
jgi:hypothetical protein